jgi:catechol 2,3-dioxygenase-like lactoylglutathione lyase family enzyme
MPAHLEHTNFTVADVDATAEWMCDLFGWHIRWAGPSINDGRSVHVGTKDHYLALYSPGAPHVARDNNYNTIGGLNHVGVVVDDINAMETKVKNAGFVPENHADYEPGKRFYFHDHDGIEYEVVAYS